MKKISFAFVCAVALLTFAGCKKKGGGANEAMAKMSSVADEMCACKDKACADKVQDNYVKWGQEQAKKASGNTEAAKMTEEDTKKYTDCMTKLMTPDPAAAAPPAAPPADPAAGGTPPAGDKPADPAAAPPAGDKPADPAAGGAKPEEKK